MLCYVLLCYDLTYTLYKDNNGILGQSLVGVNILWAGLFSDDLFSEYGKWHCAGKWHFVDRRYFKKDRLNIFPILIYMLYFLYAILINMCV